MLMTQKDINHRRFMKGLMCFMKIHWTKLITNTAYTLEAILVWWLFVDPFWWSFHTWSDGRSLRHEMYSVAANLAASFAQARRLSRAFQGSYGVPEKGGFRSNDHETEACPFILPAEMIRAFNGHKSLQLPIAKSLPLPITTTFRNLKRF